MGMSRTPLRARENERTSLNPPKREYVWGDESYVVAGPVGAVAACFAIMNCPYTSFRRAYVARLHNGRIH